MKKKKPQTIATLMSAALFVFSGCVDNTYDLSGDIDLTISVGGEEFAIPGGKTEEILLGDILQVEEGDLVQIDADGNYYLEQKGDETYQTSIRVNDVVIESPEIVPVVKEIYFDTPSGSLPARATGSISAPLPDDFEATFKLTSTLPEEIVQLSYVYLSMQGDLTLTFEQELISRIYLDDLDIIFPDYLISDDLTNGVYHIDHTSIDRDGSLKINLVVKAIDCSRLPEGSIADGQISITDRITVSGTASLNPEDITGEVPQRISLPLRMDTQLNNILVSKVLARINPDVDLTIDPVAINDLPDYLTDEEVVLDVKNPMLIFDVNNQSPADVRLSGTITSQYNADRNLDDVNVVFPNIDILSNLTPAPTHYCLWTGESRQGTQPEDTTFIQVATLPDLVNRIPDRIAVDVQPSVDPEKTVEIEVNTNYVFDTNYRIRVPFQFGPNLSIVYKDTLNGWMQDLEDYSIQHVRLTANLINKIPLNLKLSATPLTKASADDADDQGFELDGVSVHVIVDGNKDQVIPAGDQNSPAQADIVLEILESTPGQLKKLDGIFLRAVADSQNSDGKYLNKKQSIQLTDIRLKVPGGATINGNDL